MIYVTRPSTLEYFTKGYSHVYLYVSHYQVRLLSLSFASETWSSNESCDLSCQPNEKMRA